MSDFGVISEGEITLWRQLSPGPYCPNDLRRGLLWLQGTSGVEIGIMKKIAPQSKFEPLKTKKRFPNQGMNCTSVYKEKEATSTVQKICV